MTKDEIRKLIVTKFINQSSNLAKVFFKNKPHLIGVFTNMDDSQELYKQYKFRFVDSSKMSDFMKSEYKDKSLTVTLDCNDIENVPISVE